MSGCSLLSGGVPMSASEPDWEGLISRTPSGGLLNVDTPFGGVVAACRSQSAPSYLATPYSCEVRGDDGGWDRGLSVVAQTRAARWMCHFAAEAVTAVSPVVLACEIVSADFEGWLDPLDDGFWAQWCQSLLASSRAVIVPPIEGWARSRGVWREVCWALSVNVPVYLVKAGSVG